MHKKTTHDHFIAHSWLCSYKSYSLIPPHNILNVERTMAKTNLQSSNHTLPTLTGLLRQWGFNFQINIISTRKVCPVTLMSRQINRKKLLKIEFRWFRSSLYVSRKLRGTYAQNLYKNLGGHLQNLGGTFSSFRKLGGTMSPCPPPSYTPGENE